MCSEIGYERLGFRFGEAQIGHEDTLLYSLGVTNPAGQVFIGVLERSGGDVRPGTHIREVGPDHTLGSVHRNHRMAGDTALRGEQLLTFSLGALSRSRRLRGWLGRQRLHVGHPSLKILRLLRYDAVRHPAVLNSAELPALSRVITLGLRGEPHPRLPIWKNIPFRGKLGNPKTVDHVVAAHPKRNHPPHWNV